MTDATSSMYLQEQGSIADVLQSDLAKIESLVEEAVRQLSSAASASSVRPLDACEVMEAMNRHHLNELLPRIQEADTAFEQLCSHCIQCKVGEAEFHLSTLQGCIRGVLWQPTHVVRNLSSQCKTVLTLQVRQS